jgi:PAS domain S-box-containing protein
LNLPLARGEAFEPLLRICHELDSPIRAFPAPDSAAERALLACATHVFLQTPDAPAADEALRRVFHPADREHLNVFLSFIRTAHYWTKLHPELTFEDDVAELLKAHEALAAAILNDPEACGEGLSSQIAADLASLQQLRKENARITEAYETLTVDHQVVEQSLRDRDTTLRDLVSAIPAAVYACDTEGRVIYHNRQATELWGRKSQSLEHVRAFLDWQGLYRTDGTVIRSEDEPIRGVMTSGTPVINQELVLERTDASRVDVLVNIAPLRNSAGRLCGAVCILQDISGIKRAKEEREHLVAELKRSNYELSRFSHAVSHDLQSPIRSVRFLTQLLIRRNDCLPQGAARLADLIEQAASGMEDMVDSLLRYAQAGKGELRRETVSTEAVVDAVRLSLGALIEKTGARISCSALPIVEADPVLLQLLFQNLIANAIKYCRPGHPPVIAIEGDRCDEGWKFAVTDHGQGIPREHQGTIFEPLERLHGSETPGSGLGLALCRTIVARHGGRIWVESKGAGTGATFRFTLETC